MGLGLIQERQQDSIAAYRALPGEYVGEGGWSREDHNVPLAELAFRAAQARTPDWPWADYLGEDIDTAFVAHREVLYSYRGRW